MLSEDPMNFSDYPREAVLTIRANPHVVQLATLQRHFGRTTYIKSRTKLVETAVRAFHKLYVVPYLAATNQQPKETVDENNNANETKT